MNEPLRILLADDHVLFRRGVVSALASRPDIEVVGEAGNGLAAIDLARETMPDVILMDIDMPRLDGLEATRQIKREMPHVKIVILTVSDDDAHLFEAIKCGAQGYLLKDLKVNQLFDMIETVARGEASFSGAIALRILQEFQPPAEASPPEPEITGQLTAREIGVLELVVEGLSNREIGAALCISDGTVKNHLENILDKLHLRNRLQAAVYAVRQGLVGESTGTE